MSYKTILTFHESDLPKAVLEPVIVFARSLEAHLSVVVLEQMPAPPMALGYGGAAFELWGEDYNRALEKLNQNAEAIKQWITGHSQAADLSFNVDVEYDQTGMLERKLGQRARYADITVISSQYDDADIILQQVLKGTLFDTGRPVFNLNGHMAGFETFDKILIAWDAGAQAAKSVKQALPFLKQAKEVHIAMVNPKSTAGGHGPEPGVGLATYLARHDVTVSIHALADTGRTVAETLLQHALDMDAQMVVMGGYGHNRLQEWLFGSTTSHMLKQVKLPVFLSH